MSKAKSCLGYSDCRTVKLDLDDMPYSRAKEIAILITNLFDLGGYLILKSSDNCYHVVFNRYVSWTENVAIMGRVSLLLLKENPKVMKWFLMQCIKGSSTLRVTPKKDKLAPRVVYKNGKQNRAINNFLKDRKRIKKIHKRIKNSIST
jgi:hypothetical protein